MKSTLHYGLFYEVGKEIHVFGYIDANWASSMYNRRSTNGFMFSPGSVVVTWSSKKQPIVALSSTQAEYRGVTMATCEAVWLQKLLCDLDMQVNGPVVIYCDNMSSIQLARNLVFHARTKHSTIGHPFPSSSTSLLKFTSSSSTFQAPYLLIQLVDFEMLLAP